MLERFKLISLRQIGTDIRVEGQQADQAAKNGITHSNGVTGLLAIGLKHTASGLTTAAFPVWNVCDRKRRPGTNDPELLDNLGYLPQNRLWNLEPQCLRGLAVAGPVVSKIAKRKTGET